MVTKFTRTTILAILAVLAINSAASAMIMCPQIIGIIGGKPIHPVCGPIHFIGPVK